MKLPDTDAWRHLGRTANADFYEVEPGILAIVPDQGCTDDETTATESVEFQHAHWRESGSKGGAIIFMDRVLDSQAGARKVYATLPNPQLITGFALLGGTVLGRAVASVFIGLSRPAAPTKMFGDVPKALAWLREQKRG